MLPAKKNTTYNFSLVGELTPRSGHYPVPGAVTVLLLHTVPRDDLKVIFKNILA